MDCESLEEYQIGRVSSPACAVANARFAALFSIAARQLLRMTSDDVGRIKGRIRCHLKAHRRRYLRLVLVEFFGYGGGAPGANMSGATVPRTNTIS